MGCIACWVDNEGMITTGGPTTSGITPQSCLIPGKTVIAAGAGIGWAMRQWLRRMGEGIDSEQPAGFTGTTTLYIEGSASRRPMESWPVAVCCALTCQSERIFSKTISCPLSVMWLAGECSDQKRGL